MWLHHLLLWLDGAPARYWTCAWLIFTLVAASALLAWFRPASAERGRWNAPWIFAALMALALFAFRWPVIFDNRPDINPDESQMLAGARTLQFDPVFWRSVDGHTAGPLVQWPLTLLGNAGAPLHYTTSRLFSLLLMWTALTATWLTLRVRFGDGLARLLSLPAILFVAGALFMEFAQYTSEQVPLTLVAIAGWLLAGVLFPTVNFTRPWRFALAGLVLGSVPFAKLQAAPIGLWLGVFALASIFLERTQPLPARFRLAAWLIGGALIVPAALLLLLLACGVWPDFWKSYILDNLYYMEARLFPLRDSPMWFYEMGRIAETFLSFFVPLLALLIVGGFLRWRRARGVESRFSIFALGIFLVAFYATVAPGRPFQHYLQFVVMPLTLAAGSFSGATILAAQPDASLAPSLRRSMPAFLCVTIFVVVSLAFQIRARALAPVLQFGRYTATAGELQRRPASTLLRSLAGPSDHIAIWGWETAILVEAGLPHATREAHSYRQIALLPLRDYYRERYWRDFQRANPPLFIDTVGGTNFIFRDREAVGHETFQTLAQYIATHYRLVSDTDGTRVYLRRDR